MVRNELIVAVGVEDAMDGDASELLRAQEPELAGYSSRERGARGSVAKPTMLTDAIRGSGAAKGRDGRNVRVEYCFPKVLDAGAGGGSWTVGVMRMWGNVYSTGNRPSLWQQGLPAATG